MLPKSLREQLYYYASYFGGLKEVEKVLTQRQLEDLTLHNDPILIVDPTMPIFNDPQANPIDLTGYGFNAGSSFSVYDDKDNFLYKRFSQRSFGDHPFDKETLTKTDHAHYLQLVFNSSYPTRLFLWINRKPFISKVKRVIQNSKLERDRQIIRSGTELLMTLGRSIIINGNPIEIYYMENLEGNTNLENLKSIAQDNSQYFTYSPKDVIYLRPRESLWTYIEQDGTPIIPTQDSSHYVGLTPDQVDIISENFFIINFKRRHSKKITANKSISPSTLGISSRNKVVSASLLLERL